MKYSKSMKYSKRQEEEYLKYKSAIKEARKSKTLAHVKIVTKKTYFKAKKDLRAQRKILKLPTSVSSKQAIKAFMDMGLNRKQLVLVAAYMAGYDGIPYDEIVKDSALMKKVENQINKFNRMSHADQNALLYDYLQANGNDELQYFGGAF